MIDLHNKCLASLKDDWNYWIFFTLFININISVNEILMKSKMQNKTKKNCTNFSLSQHGTACCALMHSATYITFSQSGSHLCITFVTARVKISQNVDILAKVYLVEHCQTLRVVSTFTGQNEFLTGKKYCLVLLRVVKMTVKNVPVCTFGSTVKRVS